MVSNRKIMTKEEKVIKVMEAFDKMSEAQLREQFLPDKEDILRDIAKALEFDDEYLEDMFEIFTC